MQRSTLAHLPVVARAVARALALAVGLALAVLPTPGAAQAGEGQVGPALGSVAPDAELEDLDGNAVRLLDYVAGKPTLIEFWASWCENCEALLPQMDQIRSEYGEAVNVVAVAVAVSQSQRRVRRHVEEHQPGYPYLWDASGAAVRAYEALTTSVVVIVDADGKVAYTGVGGGQDLISAIAAVVSPGP